MPAPRFEVADLRRPGSPMVALAVKLPADLVDTLRNRAEGLGCFRVEVSQ
jgi:hypothetical protein